MVEKTIEPKGYKATEVGVIPADWQLIQLGDYSQITKLAGFEYSKHFNSYKDGGEIIVIRGTNITNNKLNLSDVKNIPVNVSNLLIRSKLNKGDLVFAYVGTIGPVYLITEDNKYHLGPNTAKISVDRNILPEYMFIYFTSQYIKDEIENHISVGAQASLSMTKIRKFKILLPPIEEQKAIVEVLTDTDNTILSLEKLIDKKKKIKQGAMQQLLTGEKRLPGFNDDWQTKKVAEFTYVSSGGTPSTNHPEYWNGNIRWMNSGELNLKRVYEVEGRITNSGLNNSSTKLIPENSVLIGLAGQGKTRGTASINYVELCINQSIAVILPSHLHSSEYLYQNIDYRYNELRTMSTGDGGRGGLNLKIIRNLIVPFPSLNEQKAIAQVLSDMDAEIEAMKEKLEKYKKIKQGMMQELLTGRIRLI